MRSKLVSTLVTAAVIGVVPMLPAAHTRAEPSAVDCLQAAPDPKAMQAYAADPLPGGRKVDVDVVVLLHDLERELAVEYMTGVAQVYAPLGITVRPRYRAVRFTAPPQGGRAEVRSLIDQARELYGGKRPDGVELVHVLTSREYGGGSADCIGGVRYPERGFSAAQATWKYPQMLRPAPVDTNADPSALIHAHELGHNLGGHHHLANCVQGVGPSDVAPPSATHCTVMASYPAGLAAPFWTSPVFDSVNAAIIRGHALAYAS